LPRIPLFVKPGFIATCFFDLAMSYAGLLKMPLPVGLEGQVETSH
jgi:hypothetical protein